MALTNTPAIVLRAVAYGEADRIITMFGQSTGKVSALARGARKSQRRFGGLGLGVRGEALLKERPGAELSVLESFEVVRGRGALGTDLARMAHASYALELVDRLCPARSAEPSVFTWLDQILDRLDQSPASAERLRAFELGLLERLGLSPAIDHCAGCGRADLDGEAVRWDPELGGVVCRACGSRGQPCGPAVRQALAALKGIPLQRAEDQRLDRRVGVQCREALLSFIQIHAGGPLKSVQFIAKLSST